MPTTDLKLTEKGSLPKPGPVGRLVRLGFGAACLYYSIALFAVFPDQLMDGDNIRSLLWNGVLGGLFLVSYVINIGYSRAWKKWPAVASILLLAVAALYSQMLTGHFESQFFAYVLWGWLLYIFTHLGIAFIIAGFIGTPGCEMRAFHDLWSRLSGISTKEHICPVGPLTPIDRWEKTQAWMKRA